MKDISYYTSNCYADFEMIDFLLEHIKDYENVLVKRHHKFVDTYIKYNGNKVMTRQTFNYIEQDLSRVFWRIQRKLLLEFIERAGQGKLKVKDSLLPERFDAFLMWQLQQFRDDAEQVFALVKNKLNGAMNIDGVSPVRKAQIEYVLRRLSQEDNLKEILPGNTYSMCKDLLDGMSLSDVITKYKKSKAYLIINIVGRNNWRSKAERGWLGYLDDVNGKETDNILQFPAGRVN